MQQEDSKVPSTTKGRGSHAMMHERRLLVERQMLWKKAEEINRKFEIEINQVFSKIVEIDKKIETQIQKQMVKPKEKTK